MIRIDTNKAYDRQLSRLLHIQFMSRYITAEGEHKIRAFKYKGSNISISYNHLWSPLADQILKVIPKTWAPNSITIAGLLIHTITTIILVMQGSFGSDAPAWSLWLHGLGVFAYHTLDNVDGKQARRLHNGTPLGMIMDHGCDALGLVCLSVGMARIICMENFNILLLVFTFGVTFPFYISAWCQYYSDGLMILGKFNAVDDGIPVIAISAIVSAIFGQQFWRTRFMVLGDVYTLGELIAISVAISGVFQAYSIVGLAKHKFNTDKVGKAAFDLVHLVLVGGTVYIISVHSTLIWDYTAAILISIGFTMARTISYTLLCTVTQSEFQQFQPSVQLFSIAFPAYIFFGQGLICSCYFVYGVTALIVIEYFYFVVTASKHIARALNIRIFHVFDPKQIKKQ